MQFYKFHGLTTTDNWSEKPLSHREEEIKITRKILMKTSEFNQNNQSKTFAFVSKIEPDITSVGAIINDCDNVPEFINKYLKTIEIEIKDTSLEEITFSTLRNMLSASSRNGYISDDDDVYEQFDLNKYNRRFGVDIEYEENILTCCDKQDVYDNARWFLSNETFIPELNRIYAGSAKQRTIGHPVHYMIQTDDMEIQKGMFKGLLQALYANKRIISKRYNILSIGADRTIQKSTYDFLYKSNIGGAVIVQYMVRTESEDEYASPSRDTIKIICDAIKKYCNKVLTILCLPRECTAAKDIFYDNLGNISIVELNEDFVSEERAKDYLKMLAKNFKIRTDKKLFEKLESEKSYLAPDLNALFDEWYNNKLKTSIYPQYKDIATTELKVVKAAPKGSAYDELQQMIGLDEAKGIIDRAINYYKIQKIAANKGIEIDRPSLHMIFTGNPGTAKTSVARLFARIMKENKILSKGHMVEVGRSELVGKFVGWTAPNIKDKFESAKGGVLFIDEAYALVDDRNNSFGDEAINTIVQEMENHRDDVVVIFAGYPDKMEEFLQKNPGLKSRIPYHISFSDYDTEELGKIAIHTAKKKNLTLTDDAFAKLIDLFDIAKEEKDFGNGRYVRNVIERAKMAQVDRLVKKAKKKGFDSIKSKDILQITAEDIEIPSTGAKTKNRPIGFSV